MTKKNASIKLAKFNLAYDSYYNEIKAHINPGIQILEIGGGAHPSLSDRTDISYTIIDPDANELEKAPNDVMKLNLLLEEIESTKKYDLILTKMVLEHVENPDAFHRKVFEILKPEGKAIHFFACRHSIPSFVNRILPEYIGDKTLKMLGNRDLEDSPKYPAYYRKTKGHTTGQINYFSSLQFTVVRYYSFVGHKYLKNIPILNYLEKLYTNVLFFFGLKAISTVALVVLSKSNNE